MCLVEGLTAVRRGADAKTNAERARRLNELGRSLIEASRSVPPDPLFDADRCQLLTMASYLICKAVGRDLDGPDKPFAPQAWANGFHPWADYGLRVAHLALAFGTEFDTDGQTRMVRATLLLQRGLKKEAVDQLDKIAELKFADPSMEYNRARIYAANGMAELTRKALKDAFARGFDDLHAVRSDLGQVLNDVPGDKLLSLKVSAVLEMIPTAGGNFVCKLSVTNNSAYPLRDLYLRLEIKVGRETMTFDLPAAISYLPPGSTELRDDVFTVGQMPAKGLLVVKHGHDTFKAQLPAGGKVVYRYSPWGW